MPPLNPARALIPVSHNARYKLKEIECPNSLLANASPEWVLGVLEQYDETNDGWEVCGVSPVANRAIWVFYRRIAGKR